MENIKEGDTVMIVKPTSCCGRPDQIYSTFVVGQVMPPLLARCGGCGAIGVMQLVFPEGNETSGPTIDRLKKIDPLDEDQEELRNTGLDKAVDIVKKNVGSLS